MSCQYCCSGDAKCIRDGCVTCCNCGRELTEAMDYPFDGFPQKTSDWQECVKVVAKLKAEVAELKVFAECMADTIECMQEAYGAPECSAKDAYRKYREGEK